MELFTSSETTLVRPSCWEDKFENYVLKTKLLLEDGQVAEYDVDDRMYGQCWTKEKSSDAMWRIYSQNKASVRIRTTVENLFDSLHETLIDKACCDAAIGKVEYLREKEIVRRAKQSFNAQGRLSFGDSFKSLLVKR